MKTIVAFDLGTNMGYAVNGPARVVCGTVELATASQLRAAKASRADRRFDVRAEYMHIWVGDFFKAYRPDVVVFEDVRFAKSQAQAHLWATFRGVLWSLCMAHSIPRVDCLETGKLKIFATGNGAADKAAMARGLLRMEPNEFVPCLGGLKQHSSGNILDDNAVDAYLLLRWAQRVYNKPT